MIPLAGENDHTIDTLQQITGHPPGAQWPSSSTNTALSSPEAPRVTLTRSGS